MSRLLAYRHWFRPCNPRFSKIFSESVNFMISFEVFFVFLYELFIIGYGHQVIHTIVCNNSSTMNAAFYSQALIFVLAKLSYWSKMVNSLYKYTYASTYGMSYKKFTFVAWNFPCIFIVFWMFEHAIMYINYCKWICAILFW